VSHGGRAPQVKAKAAGRVVEMKLRAEVALDLNRLGVSIGVEDGEAIRAMRDEAAGNVAVLRRLIQRLGLEVTGLVWNEAILDFVPCEVEGIAVRTYHQSGIATGEAKQHILIVMYNEERDRLAKLDEVCVKLNLRERSVVVDEAQVAILGAAFLAMLAHVELGLTREQQEIGRRIAAGTIRELTTRSAA
jgi:hypothetical protein